MILEEQELHCREIKSGLYLALFINNSLLITMLTPPSVHQSGVLFLKVYYDLLTF